MRSRSRSVFSAWVLAACASLVACDGLRTFFPAEDYDTVAPELPADLAHPAILLVTKTNGFRHEEGIPAGIASFEEIATKRGWSLFATENAAVHNPEQLERFDVVVWHQTSGDILDDEQKQAFREWIEGGGAFIGIHGAGGDPSYAWDWYVEELIGAQFIGHIMGPQFQVATARVENRDHPATRNLPEAFEHEEEWYSFDRSVRDRDGFQVLIHVDEDTYTPRLDFLWMDEDLAMGDHPVVWTRCLGDGRVFFSALGHQAKAYDTPEHQQLLEGALEWTLGLDGPGC